MANPITIGELTDVPAPNSPINAQFHQETANRIVHRFATLALMNGWAAGNGALAWCAETTLHYGRVGGVWVPFALKATTDTLPRGLMARAVGIYGQDIPAGTTQPLTNLAMVWTASPTRWYRTRYTIPAWLAAGSNPSVRFGITDGGATVLSDSRFSPQGGPAQQPPITIELVETGLSGSITRRAAVNASAAGIVQLYFVGDNRLALVPTMTLEDIGGA